ncbi:UNVERIFIED_CONTAM: hypothetical protein Slati_0992400 [Sesamum latifolium]|uniref:Uncharacterized protein n=1 Tax=Sesamum latifolium TaxID=2727402 RepID=A0AAW2XRC7_9LAMI
MRTVKENPRPAAKRKKPNTRKNKQQPANDGPHAATPRLPERFKDVIREISEGRVVSEETLVIQKALFRTDLKSSHNRLSIPFTQISHHGYHTAHNSYDIPSSLISHSTQLVGYAEGEGEDVVDLRDPRTPWTSIVTGNQLEVGMVVQLWAVRIEEELCFALVNLTGEAAA